MHSHPFVPLLGSVYLVDSLPRLGFLSPMGSSLAETVPSLISSSTCLHSDHVGQDACGWVSSSQVTRIQSVSKRGKGCHVKWKEVGVAAQDGSTMEVRLPAGLAFPAEGEDDGDDKQGPPTLVNGHYSALKMPLSPGPG
uniref:Uncharacterized protein n=1 Tax=Molossus molossus TaxID=27622 RepID=A0A7J8F965_MOLMO|nr:hypothetical protein HJG59_008479 [Molossus molossus]